LGGTVTAEPPRTQTDPHRTNQALWNRGSGRLFQPPQTACRRGGLSLISVVIPVLNEAAQLPDLLRALQAEPVSREIIVIDGGSVDGTAEAAGVADATLVTSAPRGRGQQIAAGAAAACGEALLFLHADCVFPPGGLVAVERLLREQPEVVGGNFRLVFDGEDRFSRWLTGFYALIRRFGFYYGDSGIFVRRTALDTIGGVRPMALMEDYDLVRRLRRAGPSVCVTEPPLVTSSRRFAGRHPAAIVLGWVRIHLLYWLGADPERLALLYDSERRRARG
jgi:rSAM/selenodomain-associated transferase 2